MEKELREREPVLAAKAMVDLANKRGGDDNITVIVVEILDP
jgi:serine/threonine protein phosphatase PrpC